MKALKFETQTETQSSLSPLEPNMSPDEIMQQLASSNGGVVFSTSDYCMLVVVKHLLFSLGVGLKVVELDDHVDGPRIQDVLYQVSGTNQAIPTVFIQGK